MRSAPSARIVTISKMVGPLRPGASVALATASDAPSGDHAGPTSPARPTARGATSAGSTTIGTGGPPRGVTEAVGPVGAGEAAAGGAGRGAGKAAGGRAGVIGGRGARGAPNAR